MLESRPEQLLPVGTASGKDKDSVIPEQQKRILDRVWGTVEKVMGEMRNLLLVQLQDPSRAVDEHEKTIECVAHSYIPPKTSAYFDAVGYCWNSVQTKIRCGNILTVNTPLL